MDFNFLARGLIIGFSIAAPVGQIGVLCIRRTLAEGRVPGLVSGLGAATADAVYGSIAAFGLTAISSFLVEEQGWMRLLGGIFLCYLGVRTFMSRPSQDNTTALNSGKLAGAYASTFLLTLTNPLTILSFAAVFAGVGLGSAGGDALAASLIVLGVFMGSAVWWLILSSAVSLLRMKFTPEGLIWINRGSGMIIVGFGLLALISLASLLL